MLTSLKTDLNLLEYMIFFWQSTMDGEKVSEQYLEEIANHADMTVLYGDGFSPESVRKVLSAITNREKLNTDQIKEKQFWSNNMMVTEDREVLDAQLQPIKTLNLDSLRQSLNDAADISHSEIEIVFIPAVKEECLQKGNRLYINFFKVLVDLFNGTGEVTIMGKSPADYIREKILEMEGVKQ